jgi:hypothetical protein
MSEKRVHALLIFLVAFDVTLTVWAFGFPDLWFKVFHGVGYDDPQGFLRRCGANWAAFALCQAIAVFRWKKDRMWLAIVAGARLSDIFTDVTYVLVARDTTWFAKATLAPTSLANLLIGLQLIRAYRGAARSRP